MQTSLCISLCKGVYAQVYTQVHANKSMHKWLLPSSSTFYLIPPAYRASCFSVPSLVIENLLPIITGSKSPLNLKFLFILKTKTFLLKMSSILPVVTLSRSWTRQIFLFLGIIEFANVVLVTQLMMHATSFLSVISLRMTEMYFSTPTLKLLTLILF